MILMKIFNDNIKEYDNNKKMDIVMRIQDDK